MRIKSSSVLLAGGSGFLGKHLETYLKNKGHKISILSRSGGKDNSSGTSYYWNPEKGEIDLRAFDGVEILINLSGQNIAEKRWTKNRKIELLQSRILPSNLLIEHIQQGHAPELKLFIQSSAIGIYSSGDIPQKETYSSSDSFLGSLVQKWEATVFPLEHSEVRTVLPRIGVVISADGGALKKMSQLVKFGLGSPLGKGKQIVPWIHVLDLCRAFEFFILNENIVGPINLVHPQLINNRELMKAISQNLKRPFFLPNVPAWFLKIILGEMSNMVLDSITVSSEKILKSGFEFYFPDLKSALAYKN